MKKIIIRIGQTIIFILVNFLIVNAQNLKKIDSLNQKLMSTSSDTTKISLMIKIGDCYIKDYPDTAANWFLKALKSYDEINPIELSQTGKYKAEAQNKIALYYRKIKKYTESENWALKAIETAKFAGSKTEEITGLMHIGYSFYYQNSYDKAADNFEKALNKFEEYGIKNSGYSKLLNNLAMIYRAGKQADKAIPISERILKTAERAGDKKAMALASENLGVAYEQKKNHTKAIEYFQKAQSLYESTGNTEGVAGSLSDIGVSYFNFGNHDEALNYMTKALAIAKNKYQDLTVEILKNLEEINKTKNVKSNLTQTEYDKETKEKEIEKINEISKTSNQLKIENVEKEKEVKISKEKIISLIKNKAVTDLELRQQMALTQQQTELAKQQTEIVKQQSILIYGGVVVIIVILIFSFLLLKQFRLKKKAHEQVSAQNVILQQQKEEIRAQRDEISSQKDEIIVQRDLVSQQKLRIEHIYEEQTDSIRYAERIQKAVLPISENTRSVLGEHFILFKPKDIVSGDFYFVEQRKNIVLIAVADCTGHGVPGAFMSMLGISFLNEIIAKEEIQTASKVLDELRHYIINSLQQKGVQGEQQDGMDMAFIAFNTETNQLQFAGANNPLYYISTDSNEIITLKADTMPVGIYGDMKPFTNQIIQLQKGDRVYIFSDGYIDQFGGKNHKKFLSKRFKETLLTISHLTMTEQLENLNTIFEDWKGNGEQIDDVTVMGIKI